MLQLPQTKDVVSVQPQARINNSIVTCGVIDRKGFDYLNVKLMIGVTDAAFTVCKLQESDDNSAYGDITAADFSVAGALPQATDGNKIFEWDVDLKTRKRYIRPAITVGAGTSGAFLTVLAQLSRAEQAPSSPTSRGAAQVLVV